MNSIKRSVEMRLGSAKRLGLALALAAGIVGSYAALAPASAYAYTDNPCWNSYVSYTLTVGGNRCPYNLGSPFFYDNAHHYDYAEGWGGNSYLANTSCLEVWRKTDQTLRVRNCWNGDSYAQAFLCGYPNLGCYWDVIDVWLEYAAQPLGGVQEWAYGSTG